ncbi:TrkH family potassium uptake protein [Streptococcus massiliensis]|uniref:Potassium uptake protein, TrkH family n=1 Tax=Streptococcus massiliensis TaxID=313439 RepID=A0A380KXC5_9STRE|nr:potassium transporter TrkG [Streptococcus massiliensis]SUN76602.1 potassium uptake protein, TrkH family [Streptococcus massiliensis]
MFRFFSRLTPARRILLSFAMVILVGSLLLSLPWMQVPTSSAHYIDHLFTAVSAVCVTGLFTKAVADTYNVWGQLICMLLIQIGGLGLISFIGLFYVRSKQKLSFSSRTTIQESISHDESKSMKDFIRAIFLITFSLEALGAFLLSFRFVPLLGWGKGIFSSIFIAISAFCNAGFDNLSANSFSPYQIDPLINLTVAALIIMGGLGFSVWFDLKTNVRPKQGPRRLRFHTKVVLMLTGVILATGTILTLITEYNNPATIGNLSFGNKLLVSFFQCVSMRTAGFSSIDYTQAHSVTLLLYSLQMFIGGAPGGTAGGLKITTLLVVIAFARTEILGLPYTNFRSRTFSEKTTQKAFTVLFVFTLTFLIGLTFLSLFEGDNHRFIHLLFETVSALATVGVSANVTTTLSTAGLIVIMLLMFIGRIGPLTLIVSISDHKPDKKDTIKQAKANVLVG